MRRDWWMMAAVLLLAAFGTVYRVRLAGAVSASGDFLPLCAGLAMGTAACVLCGGGRLERWLSDARGGLVAAWCAVALMALLLVFGRRYRGGLYLPGRLNPSELVKLCVVVYTAATWAARPSPRDVAKYAGMMALVAAGVAMAGDFGLLAQLGLTAAAVVLMASWTWGLAALCAIGAAAAAVAIHPVGHLATRIAIWRNPFADVTGAGWQTLQGLSAIVAGGWSGAGFGLGAVDSVPIVSSDFVYAAVAEEFGLVGCVAVLALWLFVFLRGLVAASAAEADERRVEALLAAGIVASLSVQTLMNVAGTLNALPMTGITLPLVSHGGSSLATTLLMCGVLVGLSSRGK